MNTVFAIIAGLVGLGIFFQNSLLVGLGAAIGIYYGLFRLARKAWCALTDGARRQRAQLEERRARLENKIPWLRRGSVEAQDVVVEDADDPSATPRSHGEPFVPDDSYMADVPYSEADDYEAPKAGGARPAGAPPRPGAWTTASGSASSKGGASRQAASRPNASAQAADDYAPRPAYDHLSVDEGDTADDITRVLRAYTNDAAVGSYASATIENLRSSAHYQRSFYTELDGTFGHGTISWTKFAAPADSAFDTILRNSALLANRVQAFDSAGYARLGQLANQGKLIGDATRSQRLVLLQQTLDSIAQIQEANERLLLELEKLSYELAQLSGPAAGGRSDDLLEELQTLVDQTKFYRS